MSQILIDLKEVYGDIAKLEKLDDYIRQMLEYEVEGEEVIITGQAPIWLYLKTAHALHGKAKKLVYDSPVTGQVVIFDHDPF